MKLLVQKCISSREFAFREFRKMTKIGHSTFCSKWPLPGPRKCFFDHFEAIAGSLYQMFVIQFYV